MEQIIAIVETLFFLGFLFTHITAVLYLKIWSYLNFLIFWNHKSYNFSISFLKMSYQNQYLVHKVHIRVTRKNSLIYNNLRMSTSQYGSHSLRGDDASLWNKFFKDFFRNHDLTLLLKLRSIPMRWLLQTYENELITFDTFLNNFLSVSSPERFFMKCNPTIKSFN